MIQANHRVQYNAYQYLQPNAIGTDLTLSGFLRVATGLNVGSSAAPQAITNGVVMVSDGTNGSFVSYDTSYRNMNLDALTYGIKISGTSKLTINSTGLEPTTDGDMSIGATLKQYTTGFFKALNVGSSGATAGTLRIGYRLQGHDGSAYVNFQYDSASHDFYTSGTPRIRISSTNVYPVNDNTMTLGASNFRFTSGYITSLQIGAGNVATAGAGEITISNGAGSGTIRFKDTTWRVGAYDASRHDFYISGVRRWNFDGDTVFAGSASKLKIYAYDDNTANNLPLELDATTTKFLVSNVEKWRLHTNGFLGYIQTAPAAPLTIRNSSISSTGQIKIETTDSGGYSIYDQSANYKGGT